RFGLAEDMPMSRRARLLSAFSLFLLAGCQQEMAKQPAYRPLEESSFFADGRSARPLEPGTVARGRPAADSGLATGTIDKEAPADRAYVKEFPFPISEKDLRRGQERYNIFCAVCHDVAGTGRGKIVERGYTNPPSFHTGHARGLKLRGSDILLRDAPVG